MLGTMRAGPTAGRFITIYCNTVCIKKRDGNEQILVVSANE